MSAPLRSKSIGHYVLMKTIGEGTFGKVKLGTHILTGERVAVKVLEKGRIVDSADVERVAREIHILKLIRHPHIIQLYEIIETPRQLYLIMEYACGGELFDYIVQHVRAEEHEACRFVHQILAGVERVHETRVVHRDLKPENLLLDERKDIKIVDFGLSNTYQDGQLLQTACGSPCYAAPEMIAGHRYVPCMVDIWSCGVILFALVCGYLPFEAVEDQNNHAELYKKILNAEYEIPNFVSAEVADLISGMLTTDPEKRLTLAGIREHAWYRQIPEAGLSINEDANVLDQEILEQLDCYGFALEYAIKCVQANKHNHVTTTYYLLKEKKRLQNNHATGKAAAELTNSIVADLNATGLDDPIDPADVSTAASLQQGEMDNHGYYFARRRQGRGGPLPLAGFDDIGEMHVDPAWQTVPGGCAAGDVAVGHGGRSCLGARPCTTPVPKLNLGDFNGQDNGQRSWGSGGSGGIDGAAFFSGSAPGGWQQPTAWSGGYASAVEEDARLFTASVPRSARSVSVGVSPRVPFTGRSSNRPQSARGGPRRVDMSVVSSNRHQRTRSPYGHNYHVDNGGVSPFEDDLEAAAPKWTGGEMPLSARPRLQGNSGGGRSIGGNSSGYGVRHNGTGCGLPLSARKQDVRPPLSARRHSYHTDDDRRHGQTGLPQLSCDSTLPPKRIVQEVLRALATHRVAHQQMSGFLVRCQTPGVRIEIEVLQHSRGGGCVVRFSCVSGDVSQYKEVCAQLIAEMNL
eukprot:TRINITY_DN25280_c2_g4_i1.p1 TRINITY_DN25280_c2_g4~~TRINITY_DN25280_c2_g4_i1.p1  ORF type:complete len:744 (-),score=98.74 TRINITY_DN25280_c2_g4_i1:551-2782(-)